MATVDRRSPAMQKDTNGCSVCGGSAVCVRRVSTALSVSVQSTVRERCVHSRESSSGDRIYRGREGAAYEEKEKVQFLQKKRACLRRREVLRKKKTRPREKGGLLRVCEEMGERSECRRGRGRRALQRAHRRHICEREVLDG